jgi:hypothetical protein
VRSHVVELSIEFTAHRGRDHKKARGKSPPSFTVRVHKKRRYAGHSNYLHYTAHRTEQHACLIEWRRPFSFTPSHAYQEIIKAGVWACRAISNLRCVLISQRPPLEFQRDLDCFVRLEQNFPEIYRPRLSLLVIRSTSVSQLGEQGEKKWENEGGRGGGEEPKESFL